MYGLHREKIPKDFFFNFPFRGDKYPLLRGKMDELCAPYIYDMDSSIETISLNVDKSKRDSRNIETDENEQIDRYMYTRTSGKITSTTVAVTSPKYVLWDYRNVLIYEGTRTPPEGPLLRCF